MARHLLERIHTFTEKVTIMEVCGTHTMALFKTGIRFGLPSTVTLVSGPGCPVCVTPLEIVQNAIELACRENTVFFCFGDMMKVPGVSGTLELARAQSNANVKIMYSPLDALEYAREEPHKDIILFGVGFETTIPLFASILLRAQKDKIKNLYLLCAFKLIPPALQALLSDGDCPIDGFLLPGHVSSIIGEDAYRFMVETYQASGVITGFESVDILEGIYLLLDIVSKKEAAIQNQYARFVTKEGNRTAHDIMYTVFSKCNARWRGIGELPMSGLQLKSDFAQFDAQNLIDFKITSVPEPSGCCCGDVIKGKIKPLACPLFKVVCAPHHAIGPCMVSSEGTCAAYYKYGTHRAE